MPKRAWLAIGAAAIVVAAAGAFWTTRLLNPAPIAISRGDVTEIALQPVPEGPVLEFTSTPLHGSWSGGNLPLSSIEQAIPIPLPGALFQGFCQLGGNLVVSLRDGRQVSYGPCRHPASIRALWRQMELVATQGDCRDGCAPDQ